MPGRRQNAKFRLRFQGDLRMRGRIIAVCGGVLLGLCLPLATPIPAADDPKPITIDELDKLSVGLKVVHVPNPASATETGKSERRSKYTWWFKTTVTSTGQEVKILEFGAYVWHEGKWVFANFSGKPFSPRDFAEWYSCPDGVIKQGNAYSDPTNWGSAPELAARKTRWYYIGIDGKGRRVKGEAVMELKGEIGAKRPKGDFGQH